MARTKQTARKSAGGKAPRKQLTGSSTEAFTITDHTGNKVIIPGRYPWSGLGFFPFQVYILESARSLASDKEFPNKLRSYIASNDACIRFNENCRWRLEVFTCPQASILDCINHHEQEKRHRKSVGLGPIMLNRKELIVVDNEDWETTGLLNLEYTAQLLGRDGSEREFENHVNDHPGWEDDEEELALPGLRKDLDVQRHPHVNQLAERFLQIVWDDEGHEWALSSLMERNVALGWPDDPHLIESNTLPDKPGAKQITRGYLRHEKRPRLYDENEDDEDDEEYNYHEMASRALSGRCPTSYTGPREQPQSHMFLFLDDQTALNDGLKIVTQDPTKTGLMLEVLHAGGWKNAAQMLFTYLILCAETPRIMAALDTQTPPLIIASVSLTSQHPDSGPCHAPGKMHLNLTFALDAAATQGITINTFESILTSNSYLWDTFLYIVDSETGEEISLPPPPSYFQQPSQVYGAEQLQALTFPFSSTSPARHQILTLRPGEKITRTAIFESSCLFHRYQKVLVKGRNYDIKVKAKQRAKRWIWGDVDDTTGPLGWGQLPILPTEHVATFTSEGPTEAETSFAQPYCHVDY